MPSMKTDMNHNLLMQKIDDSKWMEYYEQIVKLIARAIEDLIKNTIEKCARFSQWYFLCTGFKNWTRRVWCAEKGDGPTL